MTLLQKRAWYGLMIGTAWAIANLVIFLIRGNTGASIFDNTDMRWLVTGLFVGGILACGVLLYITKRRSQPEEATLDELGKKILVKALVLQLLTLGISLSIWTIALTQVFWSHYGIPTLLTHLMFFTSTFASILALCLSILVGYRKMSP